MAAGIKEEFFAILVMESEIDSGVRSRGKIMHYSGI
jgi:hypothetical protein